MAEAFSTTGIAPLAMHLIDVIRRTTQLLDFTKNKGPSELLRKGELRHLLKMLHLILLRVQADSTLPEELVIVYVQGLNRCLATLQRLCDLIERMIEKGQTSKLKSFVSLSMMRGPYERLNEDLRDQVRNLDMLLQSTSVGLMIGRAASDEPKLMTPSTSLQRLDTTSNSNVDIIFVHGLNGHQERTWQMSDVPQSREVLWPRDFLPVAFPKARIYTYGYDYARIHSRASHNSHGSSFEDVGKNLIRAILDERVGDVYDRPIIWVAHSFGGLVVKSAITMSSKFIADDSHGWICNATSGVIFLATPHTASTDVTWRDILAKIAEITSLMDADDVSQETHLLTEDLDRFWHASTEFTSIISKKNIPVFSFFERIPTNTQTGPVIITDFSSAMGHFSETVKFLDGDHLTLCKFQDPSEPGYLAVKRAIIEVQDSTIGRHITAVKSMSNSNSEQKSIQYSLDASADLSPSSFPNLRREFQKTLNVSWMERKIIPPRDVGSCEWIVKSERYRDWKKQSGQSAKKFLHITGPPGCGKSTLTNYIIDVLEKEVEHESLFEYSHKSPAVLYFFFELKQRVDFAVHDLLKTFLSQLLDLKPHYMRYVPQSRIHRKARSQNRQASASTAEDVEELMEILLAMLRDPDCDPIYCIIDGVDECDEASTIWFLKFLDQFLVIPNCKLLLTSVPAIHTKNDLSIQSVPGLTQPIEEWLRTEESQTLPLDIASSDGFAEDFRSFLKPRLKQLVVDRDLSPKVHASLEKTLLQCHECGYVWVVLVLQIIAAKPSVGSINIFLDEVESGPPDLKSIYTNICTHIDQGMDFHSEVGPSILEAIYSLRYALRPLSVQDLAIRLSIREDPKSIAELLENKPLGLDKYLRKALGNLLRFENGIVSFINSTFKRFIDENGLPNKSPDWKPSDVHLDLAQSCLRLLQLERRQGLKVHGEPYDFNVPFVRYAMSCWVSHLRAAGESAPALDKQLSQLWESNDRQLFYYFLSLPKAALQRETFLSVLIKLDLPYNVSTLIWTETISPTELTKHIEYAIRHCSERMVSLLLQKYEEIGSQLESLNTSLQTKIKTWELMTAIQGNGINTREPTEVPVVLDLPTDAKVQLICATIKWRWRSPGFVRRILESPSFSMKHGSRSRLPLCEAIKIQDLHIVNLVLEYCRPEHIGDCLHLAARMANRQLCECLTSAGAEIDRKNEKGETPLHIAVMTGQQEIVEFLFNSGANLLAKDRKKRLPLHRAVRMGHAKTVEFLLSITGQLEPKDDEGRSPLFVACAAGMQETVNILLLYGADIASKTKVGQTPLHAAVNGGCEDVVNLLLRNGSDPNAADNTGRTPLHEASFRGYASIARMLLFSGATVNYDDKEGLSPLHYACRSELYPETLVTMLLDAGADPNLRDQKKKVPLHYAAEHSNATIVVKLSDHSDLVNAIDEDGNTPLHIACLSKSAKSLSISKALVNSGAKPFEKNNEGCSSISYAEQDSWGREFIDWISREHKEQGDLFRDLRFTREGQDQDGDTSMREITA